MGNNTLATRSNTTITTDWFNDIKTALAVDLVPRDINGVPSDEGGSVGTTDFQWLNIRAKNFYVDDQLLIPDRVTARPHRITAGAATANGYPAFLSAAGNGNGAIATLLATATNFEATINSVAAKVTSDLSFTGLALALSSNNTATVNDAALAGGAETKTLGELDNKPITITSIGTAISALNGQIAAFKLGTEIFLAKVDTTNSRLLPIFRGWAGTSRGVISNGNTITLMKLSILLLKSDGATRVSSTYYPESVSVVPASATAGKVYLERSTGKHYYDDGATCSASYMVLGYAVCDDADCEWIQPEDFDLFWEDEIAVDYLIDSTTSVLVKRGARASVAGTVIELFDDDQLTIAADMDSGESIAATTLFYIYMSSTGAMVFSSVAPRKFDTMKRGSYHPQKYFRCVGAVRSNGSSQWHFKRQERPRPETVSDCLVPVGAIIPMVTGYFGDGSNGSHTDVIGNTASTLNAALPSNWRVCDGSALNDPESPLYNGASRYLPNLTDDRFIMGDTASGTANACNNHSHNFAHDHIWLHSYTTSSSYAPTTDDDSRTSWTNSGTGIEVFLNSASGTASGTNDYPVKTWVTGTPKNWYTSGVLSPPQGTAGSGAMTGDQNADIAPKNLSAIYIRRVK